MSMKSAVASAILICGVIGASAEQQTQMSPLRVAAQQNIEIGKLYEAAGQLQVQLLNADDALKDADATQDELQDALQGASESQTP